MIDQVKVEKQKKTGYIITIFIDVGHIWIENCNV